MCATTLCGERRESMRIRSNANEADEERDPCTNLRERLATLIAAEIDFIDSDEFHDANAAQEILEAPSLPPLDDPSDIDGRRNLVQGMPKHLERLCRTPLLTRPQEAAMFRRMNFLKFRARQLRESIDPERPDVESLRQAEADLAEAKVTRDRIIQGNMRLVVSVVKKFVTPSNSFDEILSDGIVTLMATVEKFDYSRGFRFSTYAYRSIARAASRSVKLRYRENRRFTDRPENELVGQSAGRPEDPADDAHRREHERSVVSQLIGRLEKREQVIVSGRFALGEERKVQTLRAIARKLGISKERVRQLEKKALAKLQEFARALVRNVPVDATAV